MNRLSNIQLLALFVILLIGIGVVKLYDADATDWNFVSKYTHVNPETIEYLPAQDTLWLVNDNPHNWQQIIYQLPANSSFTAKLQADGWYVDGEKTDSFKTWKFLNELAQVQGGTLISGATTDALSNTDYVLTIVTKTNDTTQVNCYVRNGILLTTSTLSPGYIFDGRSDSLFEQLYVGRGRFFVKNPQLDEPVGQ